MSDDSTFDPEDRALERELKRLAPSRLKVDFVQELARDHERATQQRRTARRARILWLVPAGLASVVVLGAIAYRQIEAPLPGGFSAVDQGGAPAVSLPSEDADRRFVPVSSTGFLIHASSGGIVDAPDGPWERVDLELGEVRHWVHPATSTHIQIFSPRQETITVPLATD